MTSFEPRTYTSWSALVPIMSETWLFIISRKQNEPTTKLTPSAMAMMDMTNRPKCARASRNPILIMLVPPCRLIRTVIGKDLKNLLIGGVVEILRNMAIGQNQHTVGVGGGARIMRHHHNGLAIFGHGLLQEAQYLT